MTIVSCENELETNICENNVEIKEKVPITIDSLLSMNEEGEWYSSDIYSYLTTRSTVTQFTVNGYTSYKSSGKVKAIFGKTFASKIGVYNQVYVVETLTVYYKMTVSGLGTVSFFSIMDSPNCGIDPNDSDHIGYTYSQDGTSVTMSTKLIHIISDLNGISYNKWYPCALANLQWNYQIIGI